MRFLLDVDMLRVLSLMQETSPFSPVVVVVQASYTASTRVALSGDPVCLYSFIECNRYTLRLLWSVCDIVFYE